MKSEALPSDDHGGTLARRLVVSQGLLSVGAALASFGIDVWFYQSSASYASFAWIYIAAVLPPILVSPFAGYLSDRISKPRILYASQACTLALLGTLAVLHGFDALNLGVILVCVFLMSAAGEFRYTATTALIPDLLKDAALTSINGIQQTFRGGVAVLGPLLGAIGYHYLGLSLLLGIAFGFAIYATHVAGRLARSGHGERLQESVMPGQIVAAYVAGWSWLRGEHQLRIILLHFTIVFGCLSAIRALTVPHVLDAEGASALAMVVSAQGAGLLCMGLMLATSRQRADFDRMTFLGCHVLGIAIVCFGLSSGLFGLVGTSFLVGASISLVGASNQSLWQSRTPTSLQGRMVAIRSVALYALSPAAIYLTVPAADHIEHVSPAGIGRWSGLLIAALGIAVLMVTAVSHLSYRRRARRYLFSCDDEAEDGTDQVA